MKTPLDALHQIKTTIFTAGISDAQRLNSVLKLADEGVAGAVPVKPSTIPMPDLRVVTTMAGAFNLLRVHASSPGVQYLPAPIVHAVALHGLEMVANTPVPVFDMVKLLREMLDQGGTGFEWGARVRAMLDEIDPPKPPTLDEAVDLLREIADGFNAGSRVAISQFLARVPK